MAGHMGDKIRTIQNLEIIKSDIENNLIFIKGSIPGSKNSLVLIEKTAKNIKKTTTQEKIKKIQAQLAQKGVKKDDKKVAKKPEAKKPEAKKPAEKK